MTTGFLFPSDYLSPKSVDEAFEWEYRIAKSNDYPVFVYNQEELAMALADDESGGSYRVLPSIPENITELVLRSWMLTEREYRYIDEKLELIGKRLFTTPQGYIFAHQFPNWYREVESFTFPSVSIPLEELTDESIQRTIDHFHMLAVEMPGILVPSKYFVKDYVKSRKSEPELSIAETDAELFTVVNKFVETQKEDDTLVGGVVIRGFIELDSNVAEHRLWFVRGQLVLKSTHPDSLGKGIYTGNDLDLFINEIQPKVTGLTSNQFITVDIAKTTAGKWYIVEIGDAQVSGLGGSINANDYKSIISALI